MKNKTFKVEYPNPVLTPESKDYLPECHFETVTDVTVEENGENILIHAKYFLNCNAIQDQINCGNAAVIIRVKCSPASYMECFRFPEGETEATFAIPKFQLVDGFDLYGCIVAAREIIRYHAPGEWNSLMFWRPFHIYKGFYLAWDSVRRVYLDAHELEKPISSLFRYRLSQNDDYAVTANFEGDQIIIYLSEKNYNEFQTALSENTKININLDNIAASFLSDAIGIVIHEKKNEGDFDDDEMSVDDHSQLRWFRAIEYKAEKKGINLAECSEYNTTIMNELMDNLMFRQIRELRTVNNGEDEDEDLMGGED